MRASILILLLVLAWFGVGNAHAAKGSGPDDCTGIGDKCNQQEAYASGVAAVAARGTARCAESGRPAPMGHKLVIGSGSEGSAVGSYGVEAQCGDTAYVFIANKYWSVGCPAGTQWQVSSHTCFDVSQCQSKPALGSAFTTGAMSPTTCVDGCQYKASAGVCAGFGPGDSVCTVSGAVPTGQMCGPGDEPPIKDKPQECIPAGGGQTFCIKPDGKHCHTASAGRQVCWDPGETGQKPDQDVLQKRDAGLDPIPPVMQLPSGDNLQESGSPVQTTTVTNNTTINTVTQNYQTEHGTNASGSGSGGNKGESDTGDGSGKGDEGEGDGTATGGGNCETPPVTTGDPVMGMVATQAWATRCAVEAGNAAKVTGDIGNCAQPFAVEGTNANAIKLRGIRAQICGQDANGNKRPDWTETNGTEEPGPGEGDAEPGFIAKTFSLDSLDVGGFLGGAGTCPQMGVVDLSFTQVDLSNAAWWCPFVTMCRAILLLMGAFISIRLLME